jgi:hypothetical protein
LQGFAGSLGEAVEELIGGAEVSKDDLAGLAVDAAAGDDLPIASSMNGLGNQAGHNNRSKYISWSAAVKSEKTWKNQRKNRGEKPKVAAGRRNLV